MMKRLVLGFTFLVVAVPAKSQVSYQQSASKLGFSAGSSATLAYSSNNQAGDLLLCYVETYQGTGTISSVTDSKGNSWLPAFNSKSNNFGQPVALFYAYNVAAGADTVTAHFTASVNTGGMYVYEYSGILSTANPLDAVSTNSLGTVSTSISVSMTTAVNGDLLFSTLSQANLRTVTPPSGYAVRVSQSYDFGADQIGTNSAGGYTATWGACCALFGSLAAFKPASSGTGGNPTLSSVTVNPTSVTGGNSSTGTVTLTGPAPSGGAVVNLSSSNTSVATVPASVTVNANNTTANFTVSTNPVASSSPVTISGIYGATQTAILTVQPSSAG